LAAITGHHERSSCGPQTSQEHEVMGEVRDTLVVKAQEKVEDAQQKVQRVAEEAQNAVQEEAENQAPTNQ
jgi:hypothetical protein